MKNGKFLVFILIFVFAFSLIHALEQEALTAEQLKLGIENNIASMDTRIIAAEKNCINVPETIAILEEVKELYGANNFLDAQDKSKEMILTYALETKGEFNPLCAIKNKLLAVWPLGLILILVLGIFIIWLIKKMK